VRSAFVITEHGTGVSKGIGYVSFSIKDDAESAYHKILNEGIVLNDRKLRVDWADRKVWFEGNSWPDFGADAIISPNQKVTRSRKNPYLDPTLIHLSRKLPVIVLPFVP